MGPADHPEHVRASRGTSSPGFGGPNTTATKPASIASDAITILSASWVDANSFSTSLGDRVAVNTTVNAALLSGIVPTVDSNRASKYSGGTENYTRLLERWTGRTFTYNGSMVVLFNSQYATNGWQYGGSIYTAPVRQWAFDLNFMDELKLPPGPPRLSAMIRGSWAVLPVGSPNSVYESEIINIGGGG